MNYNGYFFSLITVGGYSWIDAEIKCRQLMDRNNTDDWDSEIPNTEKGGEKDGIRKTDKRNEV